MRTERAEIAAAAADLARLGHSWQSIADEFGLASAQVARKIARRYGGFERTQRRNSCEACGAEVVPSGDRGRIAERCPEHRTARIRDRAKLRSRHNKLHDVQEASGR
jgi:hypothetical protein